MKRFIYSFIFLKCMGWKILGKFPASLKKCVIIVAPHTSWHDFYIGLFARGIIGLEMHYVAKKELFRFPFGIYFRWMGGTPLDRTGGLNKVESIISIFNNKKVFRMAIAPEGTRKKVSQWKTGFYFIAKGAGVPIVPVAFDYERKQVVIHPVFYPTENQQADFVLLQQYYKGVKGKRPENSFEVI